MLLGAVLAGLLAGTLALCEVFNMSRKRPALRACGWIFVLFGFDASSGMLAHALLVELLKGLTWFTGPWPILVAGLCGPALLRSQLALLGSGQELAHYGPAVRYRRVQKQIERKIDDLSAASQSNWLACKAIPLVSHVSMGEVQLQVTNYVKALARLTEDEQQAMLDYLNETFVDTSLTSEQKYRQVVQYLMDKDCRVAVQSLVRRGKWVKSPSAWWFRKG